MQKAKVCILSYQSGNVQSVFNLFRSLTEEVKISNNAKDILNATHIVFPGVGAFGTTMEKINKYLPLKLLENEVKVKNKPFLGICVGMQVLATKGLEFGEYTGLGWIPGVVRELETFHNPALHVGWNNLQINRSDNLLNGLENQKDFYFVHKYAFFPDDPQTIVATTDYGSTFCSVIRKENIYGVQFHPEKSQQAGKQIALNFLEYS